jgi:lactocepin
VKLHRLLILPAAVLALAGSATLTTAGTVSADGLTHGNSVSCFNGTCWQTDSNNPTGQGLSPWDSDAAWLSQFSRYSHNNLPLGIAAAVTDSGNSGSHSGNAGGSNGSDRGNGGSSSSSNGSSHSGGSTGSSNGSSSSNGGSSHSGGSMGSSNGSNHSGGSMGSSNGGSRNGSKGGYPGSKGGSKGSYPGSKGGDSWGKGGSKGSDKGGQVPWGNGSGKGDGKSSQSHPGFEVNYGNQYNNIWVKLNQWADDTAQANIAINPQNIAAVVVGDSTNVENLSTITQTNDYPTP